MAERTLDVDELVILRRRVHRAEVAAAAALVATLALGVATFTWIHPRDEGRGVALRAQQLALVDDEGRTRILLAVRPDGTANASFSDAHGTPRLTVGVGSHGLPALGLGDAEGQMRAAFALDDRAVATLGFLDGHRALRARLGLDGDGVPALTFLDGGQRVRALLSVEDDRSLLRMADRSGQTRIGLGLAFGSPALVVFDEHGATVSKLP